MSITLDDGGTTATTGGTTQTFEKTNTPVNNGYEYADISEADFFARQKVLLTARSPQLQSDGTYSKQKGKASFVMPITRADGTVAYNVARNEIEYDPESTPAQVAELREMSGQMAVGSQFDNLWTAGSVE
jgi:hypothetical protein